LLEKNIMQRRHFFKTLFASIAMTMMAPSVLATSSKNSVNKMIKLKRLKAQQLSVI